MAKKNTLNDLDEFLKSTSSEAEASKPNEEDFIEKTPHQLVEIEQVRKAKPQEASLQPEELMAKITELAKKEGMSEERFLAKLLQQSSQQQTERNSSFYLPDLLVQGSFVAYNMAVMFKEFYEYFTQQNAKD